VFSNEKVIEASRAFVPAADETWRLQRGDDAESRLFRAMVDPDHQEKGGGSRQGIYIVAPSGTLLAAANVLQADKALELFARGLAAWDALPEAQRRLADDALAAPVLRWESSCPTDGLVLEQFSRDLPAGGDPSAAPLPPVQRDHAWFSRAEARRFLPEQPRVGDTHEVPSALVARLARFHFVDAVKGQVQPFAPEEVSGSLRAEVVARDGDLVDLALTGHSAGAAQGPWLMGENLWKWPGEHPRSVRVSLSGRARFDLATGAFSDFELLALGTRRGSSGLNGRKGDSDEGPIGFWLQLTGSTPAGSPTSSTPSTLSAPSAPSAPLALRELAPADRVAPAFVDVYDAEWIVRPEGD